MIKPSSTVRRQMESILEQIAAINTKIDALYGLVDQLNHAISGVVPVLEHLGGKDAPYSELAGASQLGYRHHGSTDTLEHKDVLSESPYPDLDSRRTDHISPEVQTQRLTAQLTAAYNRIAALEEQLLSQRIH
ncbi:MAG: hypothetical protein AAGD25_17805 [Cyanobacteria bacterium P01_F01_bin.150]